MCIFWMQTPGIIVNEKRDKNFWFYFRDLDFYVQCFNNIEIFLLPMCSFTVQGQ